MILPRGETRRKERSALMRPVKEKMESFVNQFDMHAVDVEKSGHRESTMYKFSIIYNSIITEKEEVIKLDISLSGSPIYTYILNNF